MGLSSGSKGGSNGRDLHLGSARGLFSEWVSQALGEARVRPSPMATAYLIDLLGERVRSPEDEGPETLAEAWWAAQDARGGARIRQLRGLGDRALFVAGFFGESLERKVVSRSYYRDMGRTAYRAVAASLPGASGAREAGASWRALFRELADRFPELMDVLSQVSDRAHGERPGWLLGLYERYLATGSERDRRRLVRAGCVPPPPGARRRRWQ